MSVFAQTFFTFVSGHLMALMLLSVWHNIKMFKNGTVLISDQRDGLFIKTEDGEYVSIATTYEE